jgi:hypothetical protein
MYPEMMLIPMREELLALASRKPAPPPTSTRPSPSPAPPCSSSTPSAVAPPARCVPASASPCSTPSKPDHAVTVFAGQDREATEKARSYFGGHPPTSPAIAILRDGQLVYLMQRSAIEGSTAPAIAQELTRAFDTYCATTTA